MKEQLKRWNQLAGTDKATLKESTRPRVAEQDLYGNEFMKSLLNEDLADALADKKKPSGDEEKEEKDSDEKEEEEKSEIGDKDGEEAKTSAAELKSSLKNAAGAIADAVPSKTRDDFVGIFNDLKDIAADGEAAKMKQIAKKIAQLK
jgi:hypothetical protein